MYASHEDPYIYSDTGTLKNLANIKDSEMLKTFELAMLTTRIQESLPKGNLDQTHYCQIHHHLFQDIYAWAGDYRTIRIAKGGNWFCYPEHISSQMHGLFAALKANQYLQNMGQEEFAKSAAKLLSDLNAIHPFRDGNGRTQLIFLSLLAENAGHDVYLENLRPDLFLSAMISSFQGDLKPLIDEIMKTMV